MELSAEDRQLIGSSDLSDAGEVSDNTVNALLESPQPATDQPSVDPQPTSQNSSEPAQGITGRVAHLPDQSGITPQPSRGTKRTALEPNPRVEPEDGAHATSFNPSSSDSDDDDETIDVVGIGATPNRAAFNKLTQHQQDQMVEHYVHHSLLSGKRHRLHALFAKPAMQSVLALRPGLLEASLSYRSRHKDKLRTILPVEVEESDLNRFPENLGTQVIKPEFQWTTTMSNELEEFAALWHGDQTTPAQWDDLLNQLRTWLNLIPGLNKMLLTPDDASNYKFCSTVCKARLLYVIKKIFRHGQAEVILNHLSIEDENVDPKKALQAILDHYKVGVDTNVEERERLIKELREPYCVDEDEVKWSNSINKKWLRLQRLARDAPRNTWQSTIPKESDIIKWMCRGNPASRPTRSPYPVWLTENIIDKASKRSSIPEFFNTIFEWYDEHRWFKDQCTAVSPPPYGGTARIALSTDLIIPAGYPQLPAPNREWGQLPAKWDGISCFHTEFMPSTRISNGNTHQTVMVRNPTTKQWQCPYGEDCNEIKRKLDPAMKKLNPSWVPPARLPNTRKGIGNKRTEPIQGTRKSGPKKVKKTSSPAFVNCPNYQAWGKCALKRRCPNFAGHGKLNGVPLTTQQRQEIFHKAKKSLSADTAQQSTTTVAAQPVTSPTQRVSRAEVTALFQQFVPNSTTTNDQPPQTTQQEAFMQFLQSKGVSLTE